MGTENGLYHSRRPELGVWELEEFGELRHDDFGALVLNKRVTGIFAGRSGPYVAIGGGGFYRKVPGTNRWQARHETLGEKNVNSVVEKPDGTLLVGCQSGIYTSSDHGQTWQQLDDGRTSKVFYDLEQAGNDLFCSHKDGISRSTDGGNNWKLVRPAEPVEKDKPMIVELAGSGKTILAVRAWAGC